MLGIDLRKIYRFVPVEPPPKADSFPSGAMYYYECLDCQGIDRFREQHRDMSTTVAHSTRSARPAGNSPLRASAASSF